MAGELAQHSEALSSAMKVNPVAVYRNNAFLPGEASSTCDVGLKLPSRHRGSLSYGRIEGRGVSQGHSSHLIRAGSSCRRITRPVFRACDKTRHEVKRNNDKSRSFCSSCGYSPTGEAQAWREEGSLDAGRGWFVSANRFHYPTTVR
jgi:hypothetical protein